MAGVNFKTFRKVWKWRGIPKSFRKKLVTSLIMSILLYNSETWTLDNISSKRLVGHYKGILLAMSRKGQKVWQEDYSHEEHISYEDLLTEVDMPCVLDMIKAHTLNWISHLIRHKEELTWAGLERERNEKTAWRQQFEGYMGGAGLVFEGWDSFEDGKSQDFLTMLGYPS